MTSEELFLRKVEKTEACWLWVGTKDKRGYGISMRAYRRVFAHRLAYELWVGPIPKGRELDHLCRNTSCVNPAHLEAVTHQVNMLRGVNPMAVYARRTHCRYGHPLGEGKRRVCRVCVRRRGLARYHRQQEAGT